MSENQSTEIKDLAAALAKAQAEIKPAKKDTDNPFFKSKYADLASVQDACMSHLTKNGLSVVQTIQYVGTETLLVTTLLHTSGQWVRSTAPVKPTKNDPQGLGSALTYMRRYSLAALVGVAQEDDDGNNASNAKKKEDFSMGYDDEQNKQAQDYALKYIAGCASAELVDTFMTKNKNKLNKLPKELYDDVLAAAAQQKADILNKMNGAH